MHDRRIGYNRMSSANNSVDRKALQHGHKLEKSAQDISLYDIISHPAVQYAILGLLGGWLFEYFRRTDPISFNPTIPLLGTSIGALYGIQTSSHDNPVNKMLTYMMARGNQKAQEEQQDVSEYKRYVAPVTSGVIGSTLGYHYARNYSGAANRARYNIWKPALIQAIENIRGFQPITAKELGKILGLPISDRQVMRILRNAITSATAEYKKPLDSLMSQHIDEAYPNKKYVKQIIDPFVSQGRAESIAETMLNNIEKELKSYKSNVKAEFQALDNIIRNPQQQQQLTPEQQARYDELQRLNTAVKEIQRNKDIYRTGVAEKFNPLNQRLSDEYFKASAKWRGAQTKTPKLWPMSFGGVAGTLAGLLLNSILFE